MQEIKGVVAYIDKSDIPGENTFMPKSFYPHNEELFCSGIVQFYSQPIGVIVAENQELAESAAEMIQVVYEHNEIKPLLTVRDVLAVNATERIEQKYHINSIRKGRIT